MAAANKKVRKYLIIIWAHCKTLCEEAEYVRGLLWCRNCQDDRLENIKHQQNNYLQEE